MKLSERMLLIANDDEATISVSVVLSTYADEVKKLEAVVDAAKAHQLVDWKYYGEKGFDTWRKILEALAGLGDEK